MLPGTPRNQRSRGGPTRPSTLVTISCSFFFIKWLNCISHAPLLAADRLLYPRFGAARSALVARAGTRGTVMDAASGTFPFVEIFRGIGARAQALVSIAPGRRVARLSGERATTLACAAFEPTRQ